MPPRRDRDSKPNTPMTTIIAVTSDEFGTFRYEFSHNGKSFECFDFTSVEDAVSGARFHLYCLDKSLPHEIVDGIGACYLAPL